MKTTMTSLSAPPRSLLGWTLRWGASRGPHRPRLLGTSSKSRVVRGTTDVAVYNSLSKSKERLDAKGERSSSNLITMYVCGPTVYSGAHVGHGRTYVIFDAVRRVLERFGNYTVFYAMNITDVDDKIIAKANAKNTTITAIAKSEEAEFWREMTALGVERPTAVPRATEFIPEMKAFVKDLMDKGLAYVGEKNRLVEDGIKNEGDVHLDVNEAQRRGFVDYPGTLGLNRHLSSDSNFALFKGADAGDERAGAAWPTAPEWGGPNTRGKPGWHLECSTMIEVTCGKFARHLKEEEEVGAKRAVVDIHGGGIDLCFPHHANEKCQSELRMMKGGKSNDGDDGDDARVWTRIFMHTGHVTMRNEKMSKSLGAFPGETSKSSFTLTRMRNKGNIVGLSELMKSENAVGGRRLTPRALRLLFLSSNRYSSNVEWSDTTVMKSLKMDEDFTRFFTATEAELRGRRRASAFNRRDEVSEIDVEVLSSLSRVKSDFIERSLDDFDFPSAFERLHKFMRFVSTERGGVLPSLLEGTILKAQHVVRDLLETFGFLAHLSYAVADEGDDEKNLAQREDDRKRILEILLEFRTAVRGNAISGKNAALLSACDEVRKHLESECGVKVVDAKRGS